MVGSPGLVVSPDKIDDDVRVSNCLLDRFDIFQMIFLWRRQSGNYSGTPLIQTD